MANTLDPMDLKQIITLHLDRFSNRKIADTLGISRNTVNTYMRLFKDSDYTFKELLSFDNAGLETLFPSHTTGYFGSISASHFGVIVPVVSVQTVTHSMF